MPRFQKGQPPGPGRPSGCRNKSTLILDEIAREGVGRVVARVQEAAENGDLRAASIVLARTWPHQRGRPIQLDLPAVETTAGLIRAHAAVVAAMASGDITPSEAASVAGVLEAQRRAIETNDHELRLQEIEQTMKGKTQSLADLLP